MTDERWEGGILLWRHPGEPDDASALRVALWLDADAGRVVAAEPLAEDASREEAAADVLLRAMRRPAEGAGRARRPAEVAVREEMLAAAVRARVAGVGVLVTVDADLPVWDEAATSLTRELGNAAGGAYLARGLAPELVAGFYAAAAEYYRAAPWEVVADDGAFEVRVPGREAPLYGVVMGAGEMTYGLALYRSAEDLERTYAAKDDEPPAPVDAIAVTFDAEGEVPEVLAEERRERRWPLAGPAAFPIVFCTAPENEGRIPEADELALAVTSLRAVTGFIERERPALAAGRAVRGTLEVEAGDRSGVAAIGVAFPAGLMPAPTSRSSSPPAPAQLELAAGMGEAGEIPLAGSDALDLFEEMAARALALPDTQALMRRLSWSFFGAPAPEVYTEDEEDAGLAVLRFFEWVLYFAATGPDGQTLAQRALAAATELDDVARERRRRFIRPRYVLGRALRTERGKVVHVREEPGGQVVRLRGRDMSGGARPGELVFGAAFPGDAGEWLVARMAVVEGDIDPAELTPPADASPGDAAPLAERVLEGAGPDWIGEIRARTELRRVYERFRADTAIGIPTFAELERAGRARDLATALRRIVVGVPWASKLELDVFMAFVLQAWNQVPAGGGAPGGRTGSKKKKKRGKPKR